MEKSPKIISHSIEFLKCISISCNGSFVAKKIEMKTRNWKNCFNCNKLIASKLYALLSKIATFAKQSTIITVWRLLISHAGRSTAA